MVDKATVGLSDLSLKDSSLSIQSKDASILNRDLMCEIDDFELIKLIGTGSYGKVILSKKRDTGAVYAIKTLKKKHLIKKGQVEHTIAERSILENIKHPFIIDLAFAFQTKSKLYFVLEYCPGGELFFHLSRIGHFEEKIAKFYSTQIVLAIKHLHENHVIYRDLKPENVLIDADGYAKLTDFGLSKNEYEIEEIQFSQLYKTLCGTPEYLAPEIVGKQGHGFAVDWWSVGCMIFEMLTGEPPFTNNGNTAELFDNITKCRIKIPENVTPQCKDLLQKIFVMDPNKRLGGGPTGGEELMKHPWFAGVDWDLIMTKQIKPPFKPKLKSETDVRYIDSTFTSQGLGESPESISSSLQGGKWEGFTYEGKAGFL